MFIETIEVFMHKMCFVSCTEHNNLQEHCDLQVLSLMPDLFIFYISGITIFSINLESKAVLDYMDIACDIFRVQKSRGAAR